MVSGQAGMKTEEGAESDNDDAAELSVHIRWFLNPLNLPVLMSMITLKSELWLYVMFRATSPLSLVFYNRISMSVDICYNCGKYETDL